MESKSLTSLCLLLALTSPAFAASNGTCYSPNGLSVASIATTARPCINIPGVDSMCCNTEGNGDICLANGLCQNGNNYYRDFCTDPTWTSPNCLPKDTCGGDTFVALTLCSDGSWCCGSGNYTACCNVGLGFQLAKNLVAFVAGGTSASPTVTVTSTAAEATITATVTAATPVTTAPSTAVASGSNGKGVSTGTIAGVAAGLAVVAIFGSLGGFFTGLRRGKRLGTMGTNIEQSPTYSNFDMKSPVHETQGREVVAELGDNIHRRELG